MNESSNQVAVDFAQAVEAQLGTQNHEETPKKGKVAAEKSGKSGNSQDKKEAASAKTEKRAGQHKAGKPMGKQEEIKNKSAPQDLPTERPREIKKSAIDDARYEEEQSKQNKKAYIKADPRIVAEVTEAQVIECGGDIDRLLGNVPQNAFDRFIKPEPESSNSVIEKKPEPSDIKENEHGAAKPAKRFRKIIDRNKPLGSVSPNVSAAVEMPEAGRGEKASGQKAVPPALTSEAKPERQLIHEENSPATKIFGRLPLIGKPRLVLLKSGAEFIIDKPIYRIGISLSNDLVIEQSPEDHTVSRYHATIYTEGSLVYIRDTSSNGTYLSSSLNEDSFSRLIKGEDVILKNGQYLKFATEIFQYREF